MVMQPTKIDVLVVDPATGRAERPTIVTRIHPATRHVALVDEAAQAGEQPETSTWRTPAELAAIAQEMGLASKQEPVFEKLTPSAYDRLLEAGIMPAPTPLKFLPDAPDPALVLIRNQMINEVVAQLNVNIRAQAEAIVAARFRQIADGMERVTN